MNFRQFTDDYSTQQTKARQYLAEFELVSWKTATKMSDLTPQEIRLWQKWLRFDPHETGGTHLMKDITDFFDEEQAGDAYDDELQVQVWAWRHPERPGWNDQTDYLIDINGWPGDNESGAIFLNDEIVFMNSDQSLYYLPGTSEDLKLRRDALTHLRTFQCTREENYDEYPEIHQHCERVYQHLRELKGERAYNKLNYNRLEWLLNEGQIQAWMVSSFEARPGHIKMLFGKDGQYDYLSEVQYDSDSGMIYPPIPN